MREAGMQVQEAGGVIVKKKKLTFKEKKFINAFLATGNGTEAARIAGYAQVPNALRVTASRLLAKANIRETINARIEESDITADEVIGTLASQMRADVTSLFTEAGGFDLQTIRDKGLGHLIKKVKVRREFEGEGNDLTPVDFIEIELHSSQAAAVQLSKILGIEKAPAVNDEDKRREIVKRMLDKMLARGITEQEARSSLLVMGVDAADLESISVDQA